MLIFIHFLSKWCNEHIEQLNFDNILADCQKFFFEHKPKALSEDYGWNAIRKARDEKDYSEISNLMKILSHPFEEHLEFEYYAGHPPEWLQQIEVSCSS